MHYEQSFVLCAPQMDLEKNVSIESSPALTSSGENDAWDVRVPSCLCLWDTVLRSETSFAYVERKHIKFGHGDYTSCKAHREVCFAERVNAILECPAFEERC